MQKIYNILIDKYVCIIIISHYNVAGNKNCDINGVLLLVLKVISMNNIQSFWYACSLE